MKNYVNWQFITVNGNDLATDFIRLANLSKDDAKIILDRKDKRKTQYATAMEIGCSTRHLTNRINELIEIYKETQKKYPYILPELNNSKEINEFKNKCAYRKVYAIVSLEKNDKILTVKFDDGYFMTFADIRLFIIDEIQKKYNVIIDNFDEYNTYISGGYNYNKKYLNSFED